MATSSHPLPQSPPVPPTHYYQQQQQQYPPLPPAHQTYSQQQSYSQQQQQPHAQANYPQSSPPYSPRPSAGQQPTGQHPDQHRQPQSPQQSPFQSPEHHTKPGSRNRALSFKSDKSHKSAELFETSAEKEAKRLHSKADPLLAMNEAEPGVVAATVKSSLAPLRNMRHKDIHGNVIDDPDRSNPTRSRWERPLDTIRSFEAAIDGAYNRQSMMLRPDTDSVANWDRRSSYYAHSHSGNNNWGGRYQRDSYYSTRGPPADRRHGAASDGYSDTYGPQGFNAYSNIPRTRYSRMASEPQFNQPRQFEQSNIYPLPINHRSYETVASGSGSGTSGEQAGYQTDPTSSDNSSIEPVQSPPKRQQEPVNDYGIGFNQTSSYQSPSFTVGVNNSGPAVPQDMHQSGGGNTAQTHESQPPPVPRKQSTIVRKLGRAPSTASETPERPGMGEKRKSWFARRFNKHS